MTVPRDARVPNMRLRQLRKMRDLTQKGLADALKSVGWVTCSERTIRRYESGETTDLTYEAVRALEDLFGMPVDQLGFTRPTDAPPTAVLTAPVPDRFYIFDRFINDEPALNRRTGACWDWCDRAGVRCLDEFVAWDDDAHAEFPHMLRSAIDSCRSGQVSLLVYSTDALGEADVVEVLDQLRPQELWKLYPTPGPVTEP
jgi:transcriptional regulator with XRE-family HTH domain